jgi:PKD repeat protein
VRRNRLDSALSDALGAIVLISVVGLGIAIAGMTLLSNPPQEKIPAVSSDITTIGRTIVISHNGGDTLQRSEMQIVVDGEDYTNLFTNADGTPWSAWSVGDYLNYTVPDIAVSMPQGVAIYYLGSRSAYLIQSMGVPSAAGGGSSDAAPVAAFTSDKQTGTLPLTVQFTDQSTGTAPLTYSWDFGDGQGSVLRNPSHQYTTTGIYTVRVTVTNRAGSDDETKTGYIIAGDMPVAAFTSDKTSGATPLTIQFTDGSTGTGTLIYEWDFNNDGLIDSTVKNPSYQYANTGKYTVKLTVRNDIGSDEEVKVNYITVTPNPPWYNCDWSNRKNITIDKMKVSGTQSDFPVLINLASDNDLKNGARSDGYDILFTSSDGTTKLSHEIETYTSSSGGLVAWVKVPQVQSSENTTLYMYFNNSGAVNQQNPTSVWNSGYKAVWHLKENPSGTAPQMKDSTSNANDGTSGGAMTISQQVPAKINGGLYFDGSNDYLSTNYVQTGVTAYSIETWIKTTTNTMQSVIVHDRGYDASTYGVGRSLTLSVGGTYPGASGSAGDIAYGVDSNNIYGGGFSTTERVNNNAWHHVAGVWSAPAGTTVIPSQFSIYIDGDLVSTTPVVTGSTPSPLTGLPGYGTRIAQHLPWSTYLQGTLDEIRISTSPLSSDWIKTEYNNQNSPPTFYYLGNLEQWTC